MRTRQITATDGVRLTAYQHGDPAAPTIVAVHGYPDDHTVWDGMVDALSADHHLVTYDVRGAGDSGAPDHRSGYTLDQLERDLAVVVEDLSPYGRVHLLAHDWGSIQSWHAVTGSRMRGRIASFTSISGPCLDHAGHWFRARLRRPTVHGLRELVPQLLASTYIGFFQIPRLPELAWRIGMVTRVLRSLDADTATVEGWPATRDGINGLELYRQNARRHLTRPDERPADVPVQVIAPTGDRFVTVALQTGIGSWVPDLRVHEVRGGHWLPRSAPELLARHTTDLVDQVERQADAL